MIDRFPGPGFGQPWWQGFLGWFVPVLLLLGIAALVVWAVLRVTERRYPAAVPPQWLPAPQRLGDPAQEQARLRYARGDMSREEFLRVAADLQSDPAGTWAGPAAGGAPSAPGDDPSMHKEV